MLFHTWPFCIFLAIVLPVFFLLRKTRLWIAWLMLASYFFYGWWNPYYLSLVFYSTVLDYFLVTLMDHCPREGAKVDVLGRLTGLRFDDGVLKYSFLGSVLAAVGIFSLALFGPATLRPALLGLSVLVLLMALGALWSSRKIWLFISVFNNLALLLFFKYAGFLVENLNALLASAHAGRQAARACHVDAVRFHLSAAGGHLLLHLPVAQLHHRFLPGQRAAGAELPAVRDLRLFLSAVDGRPHRAGQAPAAAVPEVPGNPPAELHRRGIVVPGGPVQEAGPGQLPLALRGPGLRASGGLRAPALLAATFAFAWQIYCDFSGYTDMARGVAKVMGFNLILNFRNPYLATGIGEFWTRWHISLSSWFRDYVYIPLGGNRRGKLLTYRNLLVTFAVSGIWHGASWTFLIWGLLHGLGVMITRELERSAFYRDRVPKLAKQAGVFLFVCFAWIFFRAVSLGDATLIVRRIFTAPWHDPQAPALMLLMVGLVWLYAFLYESKGANLEARGGPRGDGGLHDPVFVRLFLGRGNLHLFPVLKIP